LRDIPATTGASRLIPENLSAWRFGDGVSALAMVCPITNTASGFPMHILLDNRTKTTGEIMCEQVKCLDIIARNVSYKESITEDLLDETIDLICSFVE